MDTLIRPVEQATEEHLKSEAPISVIGQTEIRLKGKVAFVPSVGIGDRTVIITGKWIRIASIQDEDLAEGEIVANPSSFVARLKEAGLNADVFTFAQKLTDAVPKYKYHLEWDNVAAVPLTTFSDWWDKRADPGVRRAVRKATKSGVVVKVVRFDDAFVNGIVSINNETPIRQGKPFWHFQKSFDAVKQENSTYAERNTFLGAYWQDELIGFIRMTHVDSCANIIQLLTMTKHYDKKPANALIAKAVEVCEQSGMSHLMYCNYVYNDPKSSLTEFKRRNGFEKVLVPRYYIPLTLKGKAAVSLGLHLGIAQCIPKPLLIQLLKMRSYWYAHKRKALEGDV
jgi:hypothetical protein